jgi:glycosyltransferase A (GT-A) superfamily protein (DUF2064 family)
MATKSCDDSTNVLVIFLEEKHRQLVQSQFSDTLESADSDALYRAFVEDTIAACLTLDSFELIISASSGEAEKIVVGAIDNLKLSLKGKAKTRLENNHIKFWDHQEMPLSEGLQKTFKKCFDSGYSQVLLIDCVTPTISHRMLGAAHKLLKKKDIVFGPTLEGSFYLIGMSKFIPQLFTRINWSEDELIYSRIVEVAREDELNWEELELWYDLQQPEDLEYLVRDINAFRIIGDESSAKRTEGVLNSLIEKFQREDAD